MERPLFISFEGCDGCGKSTLMQEVGDTLKSRGWAVKCLREPGGTPLGESVRYLLARFPSADPVAKMFLFLAARRTLINDVVHPTLAERNGKSVILCDRFTDSTLVYQGMVERVPMNLMKVACEAAEGRHRPDITFWIDTPIDICAQRINERNDADPLDAEALEHLKEIREGYQRVADSFEDRIVRIDGKRSLEDKTDECLKKIFEKRK